MPTPAILKICGEDWRLWFVNRIVAFNPNSGKREELCGYTYKPTKSIIIEKGLSGKELLDTLLHEVTHAACMFLDEDFVEQLATSQADAVFHPELHGRIYGPEHQGFAKFQTESGCKCLDTMEVDGLVDEEPSEDSGIPDQLEGKLSSGRA